jgi:hypothetical protein
MTKELEALLKEAAWFGADRAADSSKWHGGGGAAAFEAELTEYVKQLAALATPAEPVTECRRVTEVREAGACVEREDGIGMCDTHGFFMSKEISDAYWASPDRYSPEKYQEPK